PGAKVLAELRVAQAAAPTGVVWRAHAKAVGALVARGAFGVAFLKPGVDLDELAAGQAAVAVEEIDARERVVNGRARGPLGGDEADVRLVEQLGLRARDRRVVGRQCRADAVLAHREGTDVEAADAARDLGAGVETEQLAGARQADSPREERPAVVLE